MADPIDEQFDKTQAWLVELKHQLKGMKGLQSQAVKVFMELVKLNEPQIDAILEKHGIILHEHGAQVFPRPRKNFPQVIFSDPDTDNNN